MTETLLNQIDKLNEYLHLESDINKKDFKYINTMLQSMRNEAINYSQCCKSDSELLRVEKEPTTWESFLAGYKKRAEMSGLKYNEVSELHAKTLYKCWKSFDLNP